MPVVDFCAGAALFAALRIRIVVAKSIRRVVGRQSAHRRHGTAESPGMSEVGTIMRSLPNSTLRQSRPYRLEFEWIRVFKWVRLIPLKGRRKKFVCYSTG
jgi:hypothetical protein